MNDMNMCECREERLLGWVIRDQLYDVTEVKEGGETKIVRKCQYKYDVNIVLIPWIW